MRLILIRHGLPESSTAETGRADPGLSTIGVAQAHAVARVLGVEPIDAVYASPLARAHQTAVPTAAALELDIITRDPLSELDSRMSTYSPDDVTTVNEDLATAYLDGDWSAISDETPLEFHDRVESALAEIISDHRSQTVAVFTHGGVINAWIARVTDSARIPIGWFLSDYGAINRFITAGPYETTIVNLNERQSIG